MHNVKLGHLCRLDSKWTLPSCTADAAQQTDAAAVCVPIAGDRLTGFSNFRIVLRRAAVDGWVEHARRRCACILLLSTGYVLLQNPSLPAGFSDGELVLHVEPC